MADQEDSAPLDQQRSRQLIEKVIHDGEARDKASEHLSHKSHKSSRASEHNSSHSSSYRTTSSILVLKRAKADAALEKLQFSEKEIELKRQQAILFENERLLTAKSKKERAFISAELKLNDDRKEAAAAVAEADAVERNFVDKESLYSLPGTGTVDSNTKVKQYLQKQSEFQTHDTHQHSLSLHTYSVPPQNVPLAPMFDLKEKTVKPLNFDAKTFVPRDNVEAKAAAELGQFFLKKELLISRLTEFNEKPETYDAWKMSFKRLTTDLNLSASEELEMLVKWLGPTSKRYAESVRNSSMDDYTKGVVLLWERLDSCYGTPEEIETSLLRRLNSFESITNDKPKRYYDLVDLLSEIESLQHNDRYKAQLAVFNTSSGVTPIGKRILPPNVYEKWITRASSYKVQHNTTFPPFSVFVTFVKDMCRIRNDPSFTYAATTTAPVFEVKNRVKQKFSVKKTDVLNTPEDKPMEFCPIHNAKHTLYTCRAFRAKPLFLRRKFLKEKGICFNCCLSTQHDRDQCTMSTQCDECKNKGHPTALHIDKKVHGGEQKSSNDNVTINTKCTEVCGTKDLFPGKSCAKIVLVRVSHKSKPNDSILTYAIIDDQSNQSLAKTQLFNSLKINTQEIEYTVHSCSGQTNSSGRIAEGCVVESYDGTVKINLPTLFECDDIPENQKEIPTPDVAAAYTHLRDIKSYIPPLQENIGTCLLIGRDLALAHHPLGDRVDKNDTSLPFALKLPLGWVIIGESCLGKVHKPSTNITVNKVNLVHGRPTMFQPCENNLYVKAKKLGENIFMKTSEDNKVGLSVEDREFLHIMEDNFNRNDTGNWEAPLPFRVDRPVLPNNRVYTLRRANNLHNSLKKDSKKCEHMTTFVGNMLKRGHAEVAPSMKEGEECWYLPVFGVYHPQKPGKIRAVFDSSAQFHGISLNGVLLRGPDLNNSLLNVLLRFRKEAIAVTADIEQMFHSFVVREEDRNFLRFFWYENNDPQKPLIEYRMKVHLFGNSPSPAVACYGLRKTADISEHEYGSDVKSYIYNNFYVDDGLVSLHSSSKIIDLLERTTKALKNNGNLRLHKFASNCPKVMQSFASEELANDLKDLDLNTDSLPSQRSLGLTWNLHTDCFTFRVINTNKPYTRRGVLSVINSLYDPLGFAAPVIIAGKLFLRKVMSSHLNWDDPLPTELEPTWIDWKNSLSFLEKIEVPRQYASREQTCESSTIDLLIFSDASEDAIAAVVYIRINSSDKDFTIRFVMGKAKVAPSHGHSMPRLELCASVLAVEIYDAVVDALQVKIDNVFFHTDSKVVLGYIHNRTRRFFMYVSNRVERIHQSSKPEQWKYISTKLNPADCATRPVCAEDLEATPWLKGPDLTTNSYTDISDDFPLVEPDNDTELRTVISSLRTAVTPKFTPVSERFSKFSTWWSLLKAISLLKHIVSTFTNKSEKCQGWHLCTLPKLTDGIQAAKLTILHAVQKNSFPEELESLKSGKSVSCRSPLYTLDPYLDDDNLMRVGGRLRKSKLPYDEKFPILLPKDHHVSLLLVRHYHQEVYHQGRHITQGALRTAGFWIIGERRLISSTIYRCIICKHLRGNQQTQKMSELPEDRLTPAPPFTYVGVDVFGPWHIVYRRTKGAIVNTKRWAVLFTCLLVRAVHIEVIEEMTSSCFINALRRFIAVRGPAREFRSDRGTNFVGSLSDLKVNVINVEDEKHRPTLIFMESPGNLTLHIPLTWGECGRE